MKRILSVFLVFLLLCFSGCLDEEKSNPPVEANGSQAPARLDGRTENEPLAERSGARSENLFGGSLLTKQLLKEAVAVPDGYLLVNNGIEKYDRTGELLWHKTYPFFSDDAATSLLVSIAPLSDNAFAFSYDLQNFYDENNTLVVTDTVLAKCDKDGNLLWQYTFEKYSDQVVESVFQTDSGNIVTIGSAWYGSNLEHEFTSIYLSLLSPDGKLLKTVHYGGSDFDWVSAADYVSGVGLVALLTSQSTDGTFSVSSDGSGFDILALIDDDLKIKWFKALGQFLFSDSLLATEKAIYLLDTQNNYYKLDYSGNILFQASIAENAVSTHLVGASPGGPVLQIAETLAFYQDLTQVQTIYFDGGNASDILMTEDGFVIVSTRVTGQLPTPPILSSLWYSSELVYSGYNPNGTLLWRKTQDITPQAWYDYDPDDWNTKSNGGL